MDSIEEKNKVKKLKKADVTQEALLKLIRVTIFLVKNHWAHTANYEEFVQFIGVGQGGKVIAEYLKYAK